MTHAKRIERCEKALTKSLQSKSHSLQCLLTGLSVKFEKEDIEEALQNLENTSSVRSYKSATSSSDDRRDTWYQWNQKKN